VFAALDLGVLGVSNASGLIDELLKFPVRRTTPVTAAAAPVTATVPAGHYAIVDPTDGTTKFYRVGRPTEGRWAGYLFLDVQASDTYYPIRNAATKAAILATIAQDAHGALVRYGQALGVCGVCSRTLTDAASIAAGIGPICAGRGN
jgi:hypothetical protein